MHSCSISDALMAMSPKLQGTSCQLPLISRACKPASVAAGNKVIKLMSVCAAARIAPGVIPSSIGG